MHAKPPFIHNESLKRQAWDWRIQAAIHQFPTMQARCPCKTLR